MSQMIFDSSQESLSPSFTEVEGNIIVSINVLMQQFIDIVSATKFPDDFFALLTGNHQR